MDRHRKLIALALFLFGLTHTAQYLFYDQLMWKWYWHPIGHIYKGWIPYEPAIPTIMAFIILLVALCVREESSSRLSIREG